MSDISSLANETQKESDLNYKLTNNIQLHVTRLYPLLLSVHIDTIVHYCRLYIWLLILIMLFLYCAWILNCMLLALYYH